MRSRHVALGRRLIGIVTIALIALGAMDALARPGGGSSFSGRSGSSSSSSSSSSGSRSGSSSSSSGSFRSGSSSSSSSGSSYRSSSSSTSSSSSGSRSTSSWGGSSSTTSSTSGGGSSYTSTSSSTSGGSYSGGGSSYSGSSSGGGSSPSSDDSSFGKGFVIFVVIAVISIALVIYLTRRKRNAEWATWQSREDADREWRAKQAEEEARTQRYASIDKALSAIKAHDEAFSYVLFEDFLYALYAEVHAARGEKGGLERLSPYLSTSSVSTYGNLPKRKLEAVVIGGMRVDSVEIDDEKIAITAIFTSNVSEHGKKKKKDGTTSASEDAEDEKTRAWFMEERWTLTRLLGVKSRPPERARTIGCPNCGAPLDKTVGGKCGYCNTTSAGGANDWFADQIEVLAREERGPMLTGTTEEVGTDLPTVVAKNAKKKLEKLRERDAAFTWPSFIGRVEKTFATFHESWCSQDLTAVRPYLSDNLYELQRYWVNAYKEQQLRNLTKDAKVITVHLAKVMSDKFFDAITVRVFATCIDYTVDANDKVVGGKPNQVREYTEYWTFIRGVGKTGAARADGACPNCGASFSANEGVNMAGTCTHCNVKITSGEFDWVLSRIEQDEVYELAA